MSDSIEIQSPTPKPRFMSLKWKSLFTLSCVLVALLLLLAWHFYEQFNRDYTGRLTELRLNHLEELEKSVYRSGEQLHHIINSIIVAVPKNDPSDTQRSVLTYRDHIKDVLPKLWTLWSIEETLLIDTQEQTQYQRAIDNTQPSLLTHWLTQPGKNLQVRNAPVSIICLQHCVQVLRFPIIENNARIATLAISRDLKKLSSNFYNQSNTRLLLFFNAAWSADSSTEIAAMGPENEIPSWNGYLANTMVTAPDFKRAVHIASKLFEPTDLLGTSKVFTYQEATYSISLLPVRGYDDLSLRYVLLQDISDEHRLLIDNLIQEIFVVSCLIAIFTVYMITLSWRHFGRIKQQIEVLPLLGQNKFSDARSLVNKNRRHTIFKDELDTLDDAVTTLSYQLESLEKAVSLRTREMERLSLFDTLTGLANRNLLQYDLQSDVQRFNQQGGILAVVILDLDKFKRINDSVGHQLGDMLLGKIAARLKNATRSLGLVARLGGDEFAIILRSAKKLSQVEVLCQKIIDLIRRPLELDNHSISISCSLGVSLAGNDQSGSDMIRNAEIAMYKAKENGGNAYRVFDPNMATEAHANLSLEADIRRAFENREFTLFLQPKVNMDSCIMGFESLIRWDHPDRGLVPPIEFIPAMENMGLISQLDNFVLDASCRQLKVFQTHYPEISIAVNISSTHFTDKNFLVYLKNCLDKYPIDPGRIELEITETLLMENMSVGLEIIEQIKLLGVRIAIDDFGTGYSSLSYLKKLPVDTIKIDREFIKDIPESESDMQISSVIIFLAKQLNFTVVAEGVETSEQLVFLKANQCDLAQGFLFSKPIPAHKAMILLESQLGGKKLGFG